MYHIKKKTSNKNDTGPKFDWSYKNFVRDDLTSTCFIPMPAAVKPAGELVRSDDSLQDLSDQRHMAHRQINHMAHRQINKEHLSAVLFITCFSVKLQPKFITTWLIKDQHHQAKKKHDIATFFWILHGCMHLEQKKASIFSIKQALFFRRGKKKEDVGIME